MKLLTVFLLLAIIAGATIAEDTTTTESTGASTTGETTVSTTASPGDETTVSTISPPAGDTTVSATDSPGDDTTVSTISPPAGDTTVSTTASPGDDTTVSTISPPAGDTTVSATASPGDDTTVGTTTTIKDDTTGSSSNTDSTSSSKSTDATSTPSPTTTPPANKLLCYTCEGDDCNEKSIINCPDDGRTYAVEEIRRIMPESASATLLRNYRSISRLDEADVKGYACYSVQVQDNDEKKLKLGCIAIPYGLSACEAVRNELGNSTEASSDECVACQTDLCNGCGLSQLSLVALVCVILTKLFI